MGLDFCLFTLLCLVGLSSRLPAEPVQLGLHVPPGFEVTEFADSRLANDIFTMTLDPRGRVVVSGRGYIRILVDDDHDGRADRAIEFASGPKDGAQGMLWEGTTLYFTGDGGLRRYRDEDGGDRTDGPSELIRAMSTGNEHAAHALRRGPDGWLYLLCGNNTGINARFAQLPTSPIKEPVAGCVLRFSPDLKASEIVADGFRNPYSMDFNAAGELFTFDSDNERCVSLPWYEFTRFYHVIPGGHYGWRAPQRDQWWRLPPYACDVVAPVAPFGRGSPTGVVCYRHTQFPERYRGGFFLCDWTFGKVYFVMLQREGASYRCRQEVFLESVGDNGFAPTAIVVHPQTGDLYISIGGRGTRGAVYRIRYPKGLGASPETAISLQPRPCSLDWRTGLEKELIRQATCPDALERLRALLAIRRHREHFKAEQLEAIIRANWDYADRYVRAAAADMIADLDERGRQDLAQQAQTSWQETAFGLGTYTTAAAETVVRACRVLRAKEAPVESRLAAVRVLQLAVGDITASTARGNVWEGYSLRRPSSAQRHRQEVLQAVRHAFPTSHADLDRELSRTLALFEDDATDTLLSVAARLTPSSNPIEDIHYLIVLSRLSARRPEALTSRVAKALLTLDSKLEARHSNRDTNWPLRVAELHAELARKDPELNAAILSQPEFGRPDHALFARAAGFDRRRAAEVFLANAEKDPDYPWNPDQVQLLDQLPESRALPVLRRLWDRGGLEEAILPLLARHPQPIDREKFLQGLRSPQRETVRLCLEAMERLPRRTEGSDVLGLVRTLRSLSDAPEDRTLRERLAQHLRDATGQKKLGADREVWTEWFTHTYPGLAAQLGGTDGVDVDAWNKRLGAVEWSGGDADRGRAVFLKASCASCHSGAQALGPDLHGVTGRFSRADLFTAIVQPSKDISPRYRTTMIATNTGKIYQGMVIYEATDGVLLQSGPAATVRLAHVQIAARRFTDTSLMPAGLLDKFSDREIADLYAYLKSLGTSGIEFAPSPRTAIRGLGRNEITPGTGTARGTCSAGTGSPPCDW
jgi:putative membrane-bound dehydrogenase-like protein